MTVLVIAPHPDDETLGCGGAIRLHSSAGDRVEIVYLTSGEAGVPGTTTADAVRLREKEAEEAALVLGVQELDFLRLPDGGLPTRVPEAAQRLAEVLLRVSPHTVYVPHPDEAHGDHAAAHEALRTALVLAPQQARCLAFEVWSPLHWHDAAVDISEVMPEKLRALVCHRSQTAQMDFARAVIGLNSYRGATSLGCDYAEVFRHLGVGG